MRSEAITAATQPTVHVVATTFDGTRAALTAAIPLARGARARLVLFVPQVVPYPLPLDGPVDSMTFATERYRDLIHELGGEAQIRLCLCRHADDVIWRVLPSRSTVVLGGRAGTWRASREERLARRLTHLGHHVIFAPIDEEPIESGVSRLDPMDQAMLDFRSMGRFVVLVAAISIGLVA